MGARFVVADSACCRLQTHDRKHKRTLINRRYLLLNESALPAHAFQGVSLDI